MKSTFQFNCKCGYQGKIETTGTNDPKDFCCPGCDTPTYFVRPLGDFVGMRILHCAGSELQNGDATLAIVLSAIAVECELERLFLKWTELDFDINNTRCATAAERKVWNEEWEGCSAIGDRLNKATRLMAGQSFDYFVSHHPAKFLKPLRVNFPGAASYSSPKKLFISELFNKRNRIVHHGEIDFQDADAEICFALARTLFDIMKVMDAQRFKELDARILAAHRKLPT